MMRLSDLLTHVDQMPGTFKHAASTISAAEMDLVAERLADAASQLRCLAACRRAEDLVATFHSTRTFRPEARQ